MRVEALAPQDDLDLARELLELQHRSYELEAELIGDRRIPPLQEKVDELQARALTWLGVRGDDERVHGAIGFRADADAVDIDRLVVDPRQLRRGIARLLVTAVQELAASRPVEVSTGRANAPARRLYERQGFTRLGDQEVLPGLWITSYRWSR